MSDCSRAISDKPITKERWKLCSSKDSGSRGGAKFDQFSDSSFYWNINMQ